MDDTARRRVGGRRTRRPFPGLPLLLRRHRRLVVALLLATASGLAVDAATAAPPPGLPVVAAARDLAAGHEIEAADLAVVAVPRAAVPAGVVPLDDLVGEVLAAPVRRGEAVTDVRVLSSVAAGLADGQVALPVPVATDGALPWLRAGQRVDVLAVTADPLGGAADGGQGQADVVAHGAVVLDVPGQPGASPFGPAEAATPVVLLAVDAPTARIVAARSAGGWVMLTLLP